MPASSVLSVLLVAAPIWVLIGAGAPLPQEFERQRAGTAPGVCLSPEEVELARLIQEYRRAHDLPPVELSKSLSLVAKWHAIDLERNRLPVPADDRGQPCGLHSWSDQGPWTAFCYAPDHQEEQKMRDKPNELTGGAYRGLAFENVYFNAEGVLPFRVLDYWRLRSAENEILLENGVWSGSRWPAMGVGIYRRYAVVWLGTAKDPQGPISPCGSPDVSAPRSGGRE